MIFKSKKSKTETLIGDGGIVEVERDPIGKIFTTVSMFLILILVFLGACALFYT